MSTCSNISLISSSSSSLLSSSTASSFSKPASKYMPRDVSCVVHPGKAPEKFQGPASLNSAAYEVTRVMSSKMTPEEFDKLTAPYPQYELSQAGRLGCTALQVALEEGGRLSLVVHILDRAPGLVNKGMGYPPMTPLMESCAKADCRASLVLVKLFIKRGAKINLGDIISRTALLVAAQKGNMEVMKYLILRGGVVYQACLDEIMMGRIWTDAQESTHQVLPNLARAIEELWGVEHFKKGTLHSSRSHSLVSSLPEELRLKIGSFVQD